MITFTCQSCNKSYQLKKRSLNVFCSCGALSNGMQSTELNNFVMVGDIARSIMDELGIKEKEGCSCQSVINIMNQFGISGCIQNKASIVAKMQQNARKFSWVEKLNIAIRNTMNPLAISLASTGDVISAIFDEAIRRAKEQEKDFVGGDDL